MLQNWVKRPENPHNSLYSESDASAWWWIMKVTETWWEVTLLHMVYEPHNPGANSKMEFLGVFACWAITKQ